MLKPRKDEAENVSRHAAVSEGDCEKMAGKYGWELVAVEQIPTDPVFKVNCVFEGETEFPKPYQEKEKTT